MDINLPQPKTKAEERYIRKRKLKAFGNSLAFFICRIFPIDNKLISACTFEGKGGFGCNPKYIVQKLHECNPDLKFVWLVNDDVFDEKNFPSYIKKVPNALWSRAYWLSRSRVWIDNYRKPYGTRKRKGQYYLNTWHGDMGFKPIGLFRGEKFSPMAYLVSKNDSDMIDDVLVESDYVKCIFRKGLIYNGSFLKTGQPRCDILAGDKTPYRDKFRKEKNIPQDARIVLFAPTYREASDNGRRFVMSELWSIDLEAVRKAFEKRFGGDWRICVRLHPQLAYMMEQSDATASIKTEAGTADASTLHNATGSTGNASQNAACSASPDAPPIIDATRNDDMYEVLAAVDAYITDYSSASFDVSYCGVPVFLLMDDLQKYTGDRGELMWDITNGDNAEVHNSHSMIPEYDIVLPYPVAKDNDELVGDILDFDEDVYKEKLNKMNGTVGLVFDGKASERAAEHILNKMT